MSNYCKVVSQIQNSISNVSSRFIQFYWSLRQFKCACLGYAAWALSLMAWYSSDSLIHQRSASTIGRFAKTLTLYLDIIGFQLVYGVGSWQLKKLSKKYWFEVWTSVAQKDSQIRKATMLSFWFHHYETTNWSNVSWKMTPHNTYVVVGILY